MSNVHDIADQLKTLRCLGKQLRTLLYQNDMSMEMVNVAIERENTQEPYDGTCMHAYVHFQYLCTNLVI